MTKQNINVAIIIDVEEEGLFSGKYPIHPTVNNIQALPNLAFLTTELQIPLTLVCTHAIFANGKACHVLERMRRDYNAEIGAHLHYWSTPPYASEPMQSYVAAKDIEKKALREKMQNLFKYGANFCGHDLKVFRMGRWDMAKDMWDLLAENNVLVDSSIRPWHYPKNWRDHFLAPTTPYKVQVGTHEILEIPDTAVPIVPKNKALMKALYATPPALLHKLHQMVVMAPNPVYHSLNYMKLAAKILLARGEQVLTLTWHSTEVMPGMTPHLHNEDAVNKMLLRARLFLQWLQENYNVRGVTLGQLHNNAGIFAPHLSAQELNLTGDWHP